jgi:hypothetical protein
MQFVRLRLGKLKPFGNDKTGPGVGLKEDALDAQR